MSQTMKPSTGRMMMPKTHAILAAPEALEVTT